MSEKKTVKDPEKSGAKIISWALYDWANSAFSTTVMAGFFPICYKQYWCDGAAMSQSTFHLGMANSLSSVVIAALSPFLGAIADRGGTKKKFLFFFAAMGIVMTGALRFVAQGQWPVALALYMAACIGFAGGNIFYDSLIVGVAKEEQVDLVSALGFSLGYLGGGILFAVNVWMTLSPQTFGLSDTSQALGISFLTVSIWWAVFSIPIFLFVDEPEVKDKKRGLTAVRAGFRQLRDTFKKIRSLRVVFLFLIGYWLYIDGVDTIVRMAVDYGMSIGFEPKGLIKALLITQFVGFPAALVFGKIGQKLGAKTGILMGIGVYLGVTVWGYFMKRPAEFYVLAVVIGLVQGGVQALSRSFYTRIIPKDKAAEFFGFYNLLGKFAAVIGPFMMGWVSVATGDPRYSMLSIGLLFLGGGIILYFVDEEEGRRAAAEI